MQNTCKNIDQKLKNLAEPKENKIEKSLVRLIWAKNGVCIKLQGSKSMPDRLCLWPKGNVWFVELKRPNRKKPDPLQLFMHEALRKLGFKVSVIWNDEQLKQFENEISGT